MRRMSQVIDYTQKRETCDVRQKYILLSGIIFFLLTTSCFAQVSTSFWTVKKSDHFVVYFRDAPAGYVEDLIKEAEDCYNSITTKLGFTRFEDFWTWENRCKIYLYPTREDYQRATGRPGWSGATVDITTRTINTYLFEKDFLQIVLPHEMGHLVFREFVGYKTTLPLWLDEGIAILQERQNQQDRLSLVQGLVFSGLHIPLEKLIEIDKDNLVFAQVFYAESFSVVNFLLQKYGTDKFIDFCRYLRDKKDWKKGLRAVYGFKDISQMNDEWIEFLLTDLRGKP